MIFEAVCVSHMGRVRFNNEDNFLFDQVVLPVNNRGLSETLTLKSNMETPVCVGVFDGMGGEKYGEDASYIAGVTFRESMKNASGQRPETLLSGACMEANQLICNLTKKRHVRCIGATVAVLYVCEDRVWICNLGDSRIYSLNEAGLSQLSVDHTDAAYLKSRGINKKPSLTQHLGIEPEEMLIEPFVDSREFRVGEKYLLCSDGLTDMVEERVMADILRESDDLKYCAEKLLKLALDNGGRDNTTVILCQIKEI